MPAGVFVELSLLGGIIAYAQQVIDGVLILLSAQAIMRHHRTCRLTRGAACLQGAVEARHECGDLRLRRLGFLVLLRRHFAGVHLLHGLGPMMGVGAEFEIAGELVEAQVAFFLLRAVTAGAMLLDEGFVGLRSADDTRQAQGE